MIRSIFGVYIPMSRLSPLSGGGIPGFGFRTCSARHSISNEFLNNHAAAWPPVAKGRTRGPYKLLLKPRKVACFIVVGGTGIEPVTPAV
jgi:hypothetical protein